MSGQHQKELNKCLMKKSLKFRVHCPAKAARGAGDDLRCLEEMRSVAKTADTVCSSQGRVEGKRVFNAEFRQAPTVIPILSAYARAVRLRALRCLPTS